MEPHRPSNSGRHTAVLGMMGLAAAMGIGRFAFTPLLPLMQAHDGLTLAQGGVLASANYTGYLAGALLCFVLDLRPARMARLGLVVVAVSTLAMALTSSFLLWICLRLIAGAASAFVLVGVSAWALNSITADKRLATSGWVFSGVGIGICLAGLVSLAIGTIGRPPSLAWLALGCLAALVALLAMRYMKDPDDLKPNKALPTPGTGRAGWELIACYGAFGFGYIVPATFLPAVARGLVEDPALFGWTWPVFGLAAAVSTGVVTATLRNVAPIRLWAFAQVLMCAGVALPALYLNLGSVITSALLVGGTFMVVTMAGMQTARQMHGAHSSRLMAAMTAAFATGQLIAPLLIGTAVSAAQAVRMPSLVAAAILFLSALLLVLRSRRPEVSKEAL